MGAEIIMQLEEHGSVIERAGKIFMHLASSGA